MLQQLNTALAHAIGVTDITNVFAIDLHLRVHEAPEVVIHKHVLKADGTPLVENDELVSQGIRCRLVPELTDEAPLTLDQRCEAALEAVRKVVNQRAEAALVTLSKDFRRSRWLAQHMVQANADGQRFYALGGYVGRACYVVGEGMAGKV